MLMKHEVHIITAHLTFYLDLILNGVLNISPYYHSSSNILIEYIFVSMMCH